MERLTLNAWSSVSATFQPDRDLIRGCREGDVRAWERLLDRYERLVFSVPRKYGLSREDAADITQLTFTILFRSVDKLPEDSSLGAWLATVARRHTWRLLDRNRRERTGGEGPDVRTPSEADGGTEDAVEQWELTQWLRHGLSLVGEPCRSLLHALYLDPDQPSYAQTAARLGMAVGSIGPTRTRCLKRLRKVLDE